jgi:hypothetical protein
VEEVEDSVVLELVDKIREDEPRVGTRKLQEIVLSALVR